MQNINTIPPRELFPGFKFRLLHGEQSSLSYVEITQGSILPEHHHVHEQITYLIEGRLDMVIGGESFSLTQGMVHVIPSNTPHSAVAITDVKVMDFFTPVREEYK